MQKSKYHLITFFGGETGWTYGDKVSANAEFIGFPSVSEIIRYIIENKDSKTADAFDNLWDITEFAEEDVKPSDYSKELLHKKIMKQMKEELDGFNVMIISTKEKFYSRMLSEGQVENRIYGRIYEYNSRTQ